MKSVNLLLIVLALVFSISNYSFSQDAIPSGTARYEALGYNPFIMDAAIDLNRNPAWGNKYNNYAFGDIGRYQSDNYDPKTGYNGNQDKDYAYRLRDQYLAVNFRTGNQWSLGVLLNKEEGQIFFGTMRPYYELIGNEKPQVPFKALIAMQSSKNVNLGLAPYVAYWSSDYTSPSLDLSRSTNIWGGTFGILANSSSSSWTEGTVGIRFNNYSVSADTAGGGSYTDENDGGLELNAFYRGWYKVKNTNITVVPYVNFGIMNWEPTITPVPVLHAGEKNDFWNIMGGVGINVPINSEGMLAAGVSGGYVSNSANFSDTVFGAGLGQTVLIFKDKTEDVIFPQFNIGLEWNLTDWMQGRFGYSRSISSRKHELSYTDSSNTTTSTEFQQKVASNPDQTITVGLGMQFGSFSLDGLIGERFIQIGPNILSGKENDLYGLVSMSYNFKK